MLQTAPENRLITWPGATSAWLRLWGRVTTPKAAKELLSGGNMDLSRITKRGDELPVHGC
jgi:hypothetical protein